MPTCRESAKKGAPPGAITKAALEMGASQGTWKTMLVSERLKIGALRPAISTDAAPKPVPVRKLSEPGAAQFWRVKDGVGSIRVWLVPDAVSIRSRAPSPVVTNA